MTAVGPGQTYFVYKPFIEFVGGHPVIMDDLGRRVITVVDKQIQNLLDDYPLVGRVEWANLSNAKKILINEFCGGRFIPHELTANDLNVSYVDIPNIPLVLITELSYPDLVFSVSQIDFEAPVFSQICSLLAEDFCVESPYLSKPYVNRDNIIPTSMAVHSPVIANGVFGQRFIIYPNWKLTVGSPNVGVGIFYVDLTASDFESGSPTIGVGTFKVPVSSIGFADSPPVIGAAVALSKIILSASDLVIGSPVIDVGKFPIIVYSLSLTSNGLDRSNDTVIAFIPASLLTDGTGTKIKITFKPGTGANSSILEAWVGHASVSGDPYDFDGNQVKLKFGGNDYHTYVAGSDVVSDWVSFSFDGSKNLVIRYFFDNVSNAIVAYATQTGPYYYYALEANKTSTTDITEADGSVANRNNGISKIEIIPS